jgi:hypothetical protein
VEQSFESAGKRMGGLWHRVLRNSARECTRVCMGRRFVGGIIAFGGGAAEIYAARALVNSTHGDMTQVKISELVTHPSHPDASRQTLHSCSPPSATSRTAAPLTGTKTTNSSATKIHERRRKLVSLFHKKGLRGYSSLFRIDYSNVLRRKGKLK